MNKFLLNMFIVATMLFGCKYSVSTFQRDQNNSSDCSNPTYVATMYKLRVSESVDVNGYRTTVFNKLTLVSLLEDARKKYGEDVTIYNVRWDVKNGKKRIGVIYDVIKCK